MSKRKVVILARVGNHKIGDVLDASVFGKDLKWLHDGGFLRFEGEDPDDLAKGDEAMGDLEEKVKVMEKQLKDLGSKSDKFLADLRKIATDLSIKNPENMKAETIIKKIVELAKGKE